MITNFKMISQNDSNLHSTEIVCHDISVSTQLFFAATTGLVKN